ncbi:hypothetical protein DRE_03722 [Drechslerella stenobrocha 248]|uniref:holo-[acyl-carrier-protein] synthase n=1 Tax=Drechslerella stenobrocha 248 TaxID=1043628 RepID=W7IDB4_9PEZI|nr:hypothetical protein DRE_03722 [Drechslerella stenobrocha 248]
MLTKWLLDVAPLWNTPEEFTATLHRLPPSTHAHVQSFHRLSDRKLALGSQLLQHLLVAHTRHIPFAAVRITRNHGGVSGARPVFLANNTTTTTTATTATSDDNTVEGLEYNVSHHGSVVAIATRGLPPSSADSHDEGSIGIDILLYDERPAHIPSHDGNTKHDDGGLSGVLAWAEGFATADVLTASELGFMRAEAAAGATADEIVRTLHLHWALKEAYVKAVGTGLVTDLKAVEGRLRGVRERLEGGGVQEVEVWIGKEGAKKKLEGWHLEVEVVRPSAGERYCVALAVRDGEGEESRRGEWRWLEYSNDVAKLIEGGGA